MIGLERREHTKSKLKVRANRDSPLRSIFTSKVLALLDSDSFQTQQRKVDQTEEDVGWCYRVGAHERQWRSLDYKLSKPSLRLGLSGMVLKC